MAYVTTTNTIAVYYVCYTVSFLQHNSHSLGSISSLYTLYIHMTKLSWHFPCPTYIYLSLYAQVLSLHGDASRQNAVAVSFCMSCMHRCTVIKDRLFYAMCKMYLIILRWTITIAISIIVNVYSDDICSRAYNCEWRSISAVWCRLLNDDNTVPVVVYVYTLLTQRNVFSYSINQHRMLSATLPVIMRAVEAIAS